MENQETKQCPYCGETINIAAKKCKHCGEWLEEKVEEDPKAVNCPYCGEEILAVAKKCKHCGELITQKDSLQNKSQSIDDDPLLNIKPYNMFLMIIGAIIANCLLQPQWLSMPNRNMNNKSNVYFLNQICKPEHKQDVIPTMILIVNGIIFLLIIFLGFEVLNWASYIILISLITLAIIEIKYANDIEEHIYKTYNVNVKLNKVLIFFFQSIYLNYFFLTYKERINKAKSWR